MIGALQASSDEDFPVEILREIEQPPSPRHDSHGVSTEDELQRVRDRTAGYTRA